MSYVDEVIQLVIEKNPAEPEFHQAVKEVLESLPSRQHKILSMYYIDKKNLEQIAESFNCNEKTIRRQKLEAIKRFKEKFNT